MDNIKDIQGEEEYTQKFMEDISSNPEKVLSAINNIKIKKEMERNNIEKSIKELEIELGKLGNPVIDEIMGQLDKATSKDDINSAVKRLDDMENSILKEIESMMEKDKTLINTIKMEYNRG